MESILTTQTESDATAQAGRIIRFAGSCGTKPAVTSFIDNLDHLQALEHEAMLMLAVAVLRRSCNRRRMQDTEEDAHSIFPFLPADCTAEKAEELLTACAEENRLREEESLSRGVILNFLSFCEMWRLDQFERHVVKLLLMQNMAPEFITVFSKSGLERNCNNGMEVGTLLTILAKDLRHQLDCRRYFSINATLFRDDVLLHYGEIEGTDTVLQLSLFLDERNVRFILGDNNLYHSAFNFIGWERSQVRLEQVVLPDNLMEEVVTCVKRFVDGRRSGKLSVLDDFFGYGTGLAMLFYGASGTGKTMLAKGLANHLDVPLLTLNLEDMSEIGMNDNEILRFLFREASLMGGIVFLDECDDIFCGPQNSRLSRALLLELEKSHCITILATNRPVELDPAMERRLALKVHFTLPDARLRLQMWQALTPKTLPLADDVDLFALAERYLFTGGLIKNSIFMAGSAAIAAGHSVISRDLLEQAAMQQSFSLSDVNSQCRIRSPERSIDSLHLHHHQKEQLRNTALAWRRLQSEGLRLNVLISATDIQTGIQAADALAESCGLKVRSFDFGSMFSNDEKMIDPVSQRKVSPLHYAFSGGTGDAAMVQFEDYEGLMGELLGNAEKSGKGLWLSQLTGYLRSHNGLFCLVTPFLRHIRSLPVEFNLHYRLEYPPEEAQMRQWERHLGSGSVSDDQLVALVEQYPMHTAEIDFIASQAAIQTIVQGLRGKPSLQCVLEVIASYRGKGGAPMLFGKKDTNR
jgi:hypothetical protein